MGKGDRNGMDESLGVSYINVGLNLLVIGYMNLRKVFLKFYFLYLLNRDNK